MPLGADSPLRNGVRSWPVSVGYFDPTKPTKDDFGEEMPSYQMSFTLYENGVTNDLVMDYGDYALGGSLKTIEPLDEAGLRAHPERLPARRLRREGEAERQAVPAEAFADSVHCALGAWRASPRPRREDRAGSARAASPMSATPMPISRKRVPSSSLASSDPAGREDAVGKIGVRVEPVVPGAKAEFRRSSASARRSGRRAPPASAARRRAPTGAAGSGRRSAASRGRGRRSSRRRCVLAFRSGVTVRLVLAARQPREP